ncbi:hypothetical protein RHSIM_Rhsim09G0038200 [Rhododendron simsii]|uniref:Uncharacterized protein n=1 Tax=Rhododendron simsii TaxID=118357 RepID=A0A834GJR6_RHOSS|nr:hypothetical protein RHSIM_Rhsim09G0038200 [Rhododendron simsii]
MAFKSFMGLVFSAMGGGPIFPSVFFKDFCVPGGESGCLLMRSSQISATDRAKRMSRRRSMDFKSFMGFVFSMMGGGLIFPGVFFKDFCIPDGGSGCFSMCSSRISAADQAEVGNCGFTK